VPPQAQLAANRLARIAYPKARETVSRCVQCLCTVGACIRVPTNPALSRLHAATDAVVTCRALDAIPRRWSPGGVGIGARRAFDEEVEPSSAVATFGTSRTLVLPNEVGTVTVGTCRARKLRSERRPVRAIVSERARAVWGGLSPDAEAPGRTGQAFVPAPEVVSNAVSTSRARAEPAKRARGWIKAGLKVRSGILEHAAWTVIPWLARLRGVRPTGTHVARGTRRTHVAVARARRSV